jgi:hypothetical protein
MSIEGDQVTMDWTGCDPAPIASWGFARPALQSATYDGTMHCFPELDPARRAPGAADRSGPGLTYMAVSN